MSLATRSPTLLLGAYQNLFRPQLGFGMCDSPDPHSTDISIALKRHNLRKIHLSQLVFSVFKTIMKILVCAVRLKASSSYMIMATRTSSCSKLPTHSSSCMPRPFRSLCVALTYSKSRRLPKTRRGRIRRPQAPFRRTFGSSQ